jgi:hypothetical protein
LAVVAALFGLASPALAEPDHGDPVDAFVAALEEGRWDDAGTLVQGSITQLNGIGPEFKGGSLDGTWRQRIVADKELVTFGEFRNEISECKFLPSVRLISGTEASPDKVVKVYFKCQWDRPILTHFMVRRAEDHSKVVVYDFGQDVVVQSGDKAVLTNEQ